MNPAFVLDASVALSWCFSDEATPESVKTLDRMENEVALVPSLWFLEVVNALAMAEKRKRITAAKSNEFLSLLSKFQIEVDDEAPRRAFTELMPLCRKHKLTSYEAAYIELAMRRRLPLATLDQDLRKEAKSMGVGLYG